MTTVTRGGVRYTTTGVGELTPHVELRDLSGNAISTLDVTNPAENVVYYAFTLDCSAANQYLIPDTAGFSEMRMKITGLTTASLGVQGNLLAAQTDAAADWSSDIGGSATAANPYTGTADTTMQNATHVIQKLAYSAIRVYVNTTAAETATVLVMLKGSV